MFTDAQNCVFVTGYALGGTDKYIGFTDSAQECLDLIKNIEKEANGMTWESQSERCFAEFDPTHIDSKCTICQSCIFEGTSLFFLHCLNGILKNFKGEVFDII